MSNSHKNQPRNGRGGRPGDSNRRPVQMLPDPETLESYNYVVEGSAAQLLEMFEREQKHRHEWEKKALSIHMASTLLGQVLGFMIVIAIFVSASVIGVYGDTAIAATVWVFGMALVLMAGLVWAYAKTMGQRPLFGRPTMRTHFRPEKEQMGTEQ